MPLNGQNTDVRRTRLGYRAIWMDNGTVTSDRFSVITDGLPSQLPDLDPEETREWLESLDSVINVAGRGTKDPKGYPQGKGSPHTLEGQGNDLERSERARQQRHRPRMYNVGLWNYPQVLVLLICTGCPTPSFVV